MKQMVKRVWMTALSMTVLVLMCVMGAHAVEGKWIGSWGTGITELSIGGFNEIGMTLPGEIMEGTWRTVVTPSVGGTKIRLRFSNVYGTQDININRVSIAKSESGGCEIYTSSVTPVTFDGGRKLVIPAGEEVFSDAITFSVSPLEPLAISLYCTGDIELRTVGLSGGTSWFAPGDNNTTKRVIGDWYIKLRYKTVGLIPWLSGVDVFNPDDKASSVVVVGDDTVTNDFPLYLAQRLNEDGISYIGFVNRGIVGNSLMADGFGIGQCIYGDALIKRMSKDVLNQTGAEYVVLKIGANDIIQPRIGNNAEEYGAEQPTAERLIAGYQYFADQCHDVGMKVIACCITPWKGYSRDLFGLGGQYIFDERDWAIAKTVNDWLLHSIAFDYVINYNPYCQAVNDEAALSDEYTLDGINPNESMQRLMAQKFPLSAINAEVKPKGIQLNYAYREMGIGDSIILKPTITPENAENKTVRYQSSNPSVAAVSAEGLVTAYAKGSAVITCETQANGLKAACVVDVHVPVSEVRLSASTLSLYTTQKCSLKATVYPTNAKDRSVSFVSSNPSVVKVSANGTLTAVKVGKATITCTTKDGGFSDRCAVTVVNKVTVREIVLSTTGKQVQKGDSYPLFYEVKPSNASNKNVTWSSVDPTIAMVDDEGIVTGLKGGSTTVTCVSNDSSSTATASCKIKVISYPEGVTLSYKKLSLYVGKEKTLQATVEPSDATYKDVTWTSSNPSVASVSSTGKITGKKAGTAVITCTTDKYGFKAKCTVTVKKWVSVSGVKLNATSKKVYLTRKYTLLPTISPLTASNQNVTWTTSNKSIATVSTQGVVTAKKIGSCVITCTTADKKKTAKCTIKVIACPANGVSLNETSITLNDGKKYSLVADVTPSYATDKSVTWKSSNTAVATVSQNGVVKAQAPGSCKITVTTVSGGYREICKVKVNAVFVTGVTLSRESLQMYLGTSTQAIQAKVQPSNATVPDVKWSTSDKSVATVTAAGVVKAVGVGTCTITCKTVDGSYKATCSITVGIQKAVAIELSRANMKLNIGDSKKLTANVLPAYASLRTVRWSSANTKIATVSSNGTVKAVGKGTTTITATAIDGSNVRQSCFVTVQ